MIGGQFLMAQRARIESDRALFVGYGRSVAKASVFLLANPTAGAQAFLKMYPETAPRGSTAEQAVKSVLEAISRRIKLYEPPYQGTKMGAIREEEFATEAQMNGWDIKDFSKIYTNDLIVEINKFDAEQIRARRGPIADENHDGTRGRAPEKGARHRREFRYRRSDRETPSQGGLAGRRSQPQPARRRGQGLTLTRLSTSRTGRRFPPSWVSWSGWMPSSMQPASCASAGSESSIPKTAARCGGCMSMSPSRSSRRSCRRCQDGARIVLLGSRTAMGSPGRAQYAATKAAVVGMARSFAIELAPRRITVNVVAPGATDTPMLRDPMRASVAPKMPPMGRLVKPDEIAATTAFLLSRVQPASPANRSSSAVARRFELLP